MKSILQPFYQRTAYILISILCLGYLAVLGKEILAPLLFSLLFSILLLPLSNFLERKVRLPRSVASFIAVLALLAVIFLLMYLLGGRLADLAKDWPALKENVSTTLLQLQKWVEKTFHIDTTKQLSYFGSATDKILSSGSTILGATVLSVSSIVLFNVFIMIYTFFLLLYRRLIMRFIVAVFAEEYASMVYEITKEIKYIISKYVVGLFTEIMIVIVLSTAVYWVMGLKYAILLGLLTGILNVIPYVGIFTALLIGALITFATGGAQHTLYVVIAGVVIHLIDSNFIMPKVVGSKVRINPLIVILGVVIGEHIWGISGMFLSIPVIAILKVIFDRIDSLKPWGILLGDEEVKRKKRIVALKKN